MHPAAQRMSHHNASSFLYFTFDPTPLYSTLLDSRSDNAGVAPNSGHDLPVFHLLKEHDRLLPSQLAGERFHEWRVGAEVDGAVSPGLEPGKQLEGLKGEM